jgi:hypothetical protein
MNLSIDPGMMIEAVLIRHPYVCAGKFPLSSHQKEKWVTSVATTRNLNLR